MTTENERELIALAEEIRAAREVWREPGDLGSRMFSMACVVFAGTPGDTLKGCALKARFVADDIEEGRCSEHCGLIAYSLADDLQRLAARAAP